MKIIRAKDYQDMSRKAANIISAQVIMKPNCVLGLATGGTPVGTYAQLVDWYNKGDLDFSEVTTVNLDEYRGLPKEHPQSYWYFMNENLFSKVNIDPAKTNLPDGTNLDTAAECARYNGIIHKLGGIDLQLLGIGPNGHIGFNEPGQAFELETHCVDLAAQAGLHDGHQDHHAGSQGAGGGQRQGQGTGCQGCGDRPGHPCLPRQHPSAAPGLHPRGRRRSTEPAVNFPSREVPPPDVARDPIGQVQNRPIPQAAETRR